MWICLRERLFKLTNPVSGKPMGEPQLEADLIELVRSMIANAGSEKAPSHIVGAIPNAFDRLALLNKFPLGLELPAAIELTDTEHKALSNEIRLGKVLSSVHHFSGESVLRQILDATAKRPELAPAPSVAAVAESAPS